jgi:mannitol-specific phosphotransferase system IIBC component
MIYGLRGGVIGAIATMGMIVGTTIPMFLGGMMMSRLRYNIVMEQFNNEELTRFFIVLSLISRTN